MDKDEDDYTIVMSLREVKVDKYNTCLLASILDGGAKGFCIKYHTSL